MNLGIGADSHIANIAPADGVGRSVESVIGGIQLVERRIVSVLLPAITGCVIELRRKMRIVVEQGGRVSGAPRSGPCADRIGSVMSILTCHFGCVIDGASNTSVDAHATGETALDSGTSRFIDNSLRGFPENKRFDDGGRNQARQSAVNAVQVIS